MTDRVPTRDAEIRVDLPEADELCLEPQPAEQQEYDRQRHGKHHPLCQIDAHVLASLLFYTEQKSIHNDSSFYTGWEKIKA